MAIFLDLYYYIYEQRAINVHSGMLQDMTNTGLGSQS